MRTPARVVLSGVLLLAAAAVAAACTLTTDLDGLEGPALTGAPADAGTGDAADAAAVPEGGIDVDGGPGPYARTVLEDAPLLYYRLGEAAGVTSAHDSSANQRNATLDGNAQPGVPGAITDDGDTAYRFDGSSSVSLVGGPTFAGTAAFALEAWVKPTSFDVATGGKVVMACEQDSNDGYALFFYGNAKPLLERTFTDGTDTASGTEVPTLAYTHLVAVYDGSQILLYVNGDLAEAVGSTKPLPGKQSSPFRIGANASPPINRFVGDIDEVAVYDHVLTESRVRLHYLVGKGASAK